MIKKHYKMYKDGKKWAIAAVVTAALGIGLASTNAFADSVSGNSEVGVQQVVNGLTNENTSNSNVGSKNLPTTNNGVNTTDEQGKIQTAFSVASDTQLNTGQKIGQANSIYQVQQNLSVNNTDSSTTDSTIAQKPQAYIKFIDENENNEVDAYSLSYNSSSDTLTKESYDLKGTPIYTTQVGHVYTIKAPTGYYFDTNYFAPSNANADNYDKIRSPYYSNVTRESIDFDCKHALTLNGLLANSKSDTFNLWLVKDGEKPSLSLVSDKDGQKEERIDWYSNDSGRYVGSQKFYISSSNPDMAAAYEVTAPQGYYFYDDYQTEYSYRFPKSGYVYLGNNYYPPIDLTGQTATKINGKNYYKTGVIHLYDAIKEGYFDKSNYNCNSTSLHIFRLWLIDPNYKTKEAAPLRANSTTKQLGGAVVKYYNSDTDKEMLDYAQIFNGEVNKKVKLDLVLPTMSNAQWVIDGDKTNVNNIPTSLTLSATPNPVSIYVKLKSNTSTIKFYGDDGLSTPLELNGNEGQFVYVREQIINELENLAAKGYMLPGWYNQNANIISADSNGASRITSYGNVPEYVKLNGTTDIYNSYKNTPLYIKVEKNAHPNELRYTVIKYVDENGNPISNSLSRILYNYDSKGNKVREITIPQTYYSIPKGYDSISGQVSSYFFDNNQNKNTEIIIVAHKAARNGWQKVNNNWHYYDNNGIEYKNRIATIDGNVYAFGNDGAMQTSQWVVLHGHKYYVGGNGIVYRNCVAKIDGNTYAFGNDGAMQTSQWVESHGRKYYVGGNGVAYRNCEAKIGDKVYLFDNKCVPTSIKN